jgi:hypothetical protein
MARCGGEIGQERTLKRIGPRDEAFHWRESDCRGPILWVPPKEERPEEGPIMRSLKPIGCLLVIVLFVSLVVSGAFAERPRTAQIKDFFMWGDPDDLWACRQSAPGWQEERSLDCATTLPRLIRQARHPQVLEGSHGRTVCFGLESLFRMKPECSHHNVGVSTRTTRR